MELKTHTESPQETFEIGRIIGEMLSPGDMIALVGELGAGKTCFAQGIARGLAVPEGYCITSPTFTLINEYPGRIEFYHMDMYRISGSRDVTDMGCEEYFAGEGVAVVEWAEKIADILPETAIFVHMTYVDENERQLVFSGNTEKIEAIAKALDEGGVMRWR